MRKLPLALLISLATPSLLAQTAPSGVMKVLVPIFIPQPVSGALGSSWSTDTMLFVDGDAPVRIVPGCDSSGFCDPQPGVTLRLENFESSLTGSRGRFVYVQRANAGHAHLSACLHESDPANSCTPLPAVREPAFQPRIVLPFVPFGVNERDALRVYGDSAASLTVRVRIYRLDRLDPLVDETVTLVPSTAMENGFEIEPSFFAAFDLRQRWPQLQAAASVRVEIDSLDSMRGLWAFASVTNNSSEAVQVFMPD